MEKWTIFPLLFKKNTEHVTTSSETYFNIMVR